MRRGALASAGRESIAPRPAPRRGFWNTPPPLPHRLFRPHAAHLTRLAARARRLRCPFAPFKRRSVMRLRRVLVGAGRRLGGAKGAVVQNVRGGESPLNLRSDAPAPQRSICGAPDSGFGRVADSTTFCPPGRGFVVRSGRRPFPRKPKETERNRKEEV